MPLAETLWHPAGCSDVDSFSWRFCFVLWESVLPSLSSVWTRWGHVFWTPYPDTIGSSPATKKHPWWIKSTFVLCPLIHNDEDMLSGARGITNTNANIGIIIPLLSQALSGPPKWPKSAQTHFLNFTELIRITVMNLLSNCYAPSSVLSTCHIVTYLILKTQ